MSEKFGLDWKERDVVRMSTFIKILEYEADREKKQSNDGNKNNHFR